MPKLARAEDLRHGFAEKCVAFRRWAMATLGRLFTFEIGVRAGHHLVTSGPYRFVRHPGYSGTLVIAAGVGVTFGVWPLALLHVAASIAFLVARIRDEDAMLERQFGEEFERFAANRARLIPLIY